jgi:hypothetical protein
MNHGSALLCEYGGHLLFVVVLQIVFHLFEFLNSIFVRLGNNFNIFIDNFSLEWLMQLNFLIFCHNKLRVSKYSNFLKRFLVRILLGATVIPFYFLSARAILNLTKKSDALVGRVNTFIILHTK